MTQTRTFTYNGQDMVSAANPENGTVTYTYDASHRAITRTDAKSQQTQYAYNTLGQLTQVTHGTVSGGTFTADSTSGVSYSYDAYGRTSTVQFGAADLNFARTFTYNYTYNQANRILTQTMGWNMYNSAGSGSPPTTAESFGMSYQWDNEGKMTSYNDLSGQQYLYTYDGMGRATNLNGAVDNASATYGAANQVLTLSYSAASGGGSVSETRTYNSLLQLTQLTASGSRTMNMTYNCPTYNNGRISSAVDGVNSQTVNYTYDSLNRLTAAQATGGWGESYTYDGFGNLSAISPTAQGGETWSATINESTNRMVGVNYDANGNQIGDQVYTNYVWNVENRMVQQLTAGSGGTWYGGTGFSYDTSGRRVMKNVNADPAGTVTGTGYGAGTWEFYFYGLNGRKMGTIDCSYGTGYLDGCWLTGQNAYFAGKLIVEMGSTVATDRLGSVRANGAYNSGDIQYFPYGAEQTATTEGWSKFGTYFRDAMGQDYAEQRYYNGGMGRFWSPDRMAGVAANPGSLNKYAYANGDPVNFRDPRGLLFQASDGTIYYSYSECVDENEYAGRVCPIDDGDAGVQTICSSTAGMSFAEVVACDVPQKPAAAAPLPMECVADLYNRPVQITWLYILTAATHSYWQIQEYNPNTGTDVFNVAISGFPTKGTNPSTGKPQTYINVFVNPPGQQPDPGQGTPYFSTGLNSDNCAGVLAMFNAAWNWKENSIPYSLNFNSNTVAHVMATILGYPDLPPPAYAYGWNGGS